MATFRTGTMDTLERTMARMQRQPLLWLTLIAAVPRLFAAIFSEGFYALDDHFLVIESAQSWVAGHDYNEWLPWNQTKGQGPTGHMLVYPGFHYLLFKACGAVGFTDPDGKMVLVRLLHAAWSLITVRMGYRIARRLGNERIAWGAGLFLALYAYLPFLSVRNLVEMVSAPLLLSSGWWLLRSEGPEGDGSRRPLLLKPLIIAGLLAGLAINIRFQTVFFTAGAGLALLLLKRVRGALVFGGCALLPLLVLQGGIDLAIWGRPFVEITEYVRFNLANPDNTGIVSPWYNYLLLFVGAFIPPFSLAVLFGFARSTRPLVLWLPVLVFVGFHSVFPNKQERFMLSILPLLFVLGYVGWEHYRERSTWWLRHNGLWKGILTFTWTVNLLLLVPLSVSSSKHERVEAMRVVRGMSDVHGLLLEDTEEGSPFMAPLYYRDVWDQSKDPYGDRSVDLRDFYSKHAPEHRPNVVLFIGREHLVERLAHIMRTMGPMDYVGYARPGLLDRTLHWLNPVNRNEEVYIFRTRGPWPEPGSGQVPVRTR